MSATYTAAAATEALLVATLAGTKYDTGLDILKLENIAQRPLPRVRKKYHMPLKAS